MNTRPYHQRRRAESVRATQAAILDAVDQIFLRAPGRLFTLSEVAARAEVTEQTIFRHYGSKAALIEAAATRWLALGQIERDAVAPGDIDAIAAYLGDHYDRTGTTMLGLLAVEAQVPDVAAITQRGRDLHHAWVRRAFAPALKAMGRAPRRTRTATLVAVTDVTTWKVLTLDEGLTRREYVHSLRELVVAVGVTRRPDRVRTPERHGPEASDARRPRCLSALASLT